MLELSEDVALEEETHVLLLQACCWWRWRWRSGLLWGHGGCGAL